MASAIGIETLTNLKTDTQVLAVLSGLPTGTLRFRASRVPRVETAQIVPCTGTGPYTLTLPHPDLWYCWAEDDNGVGLQSAAVWAGLSGIQSLDEAGMRLCEILTENRVGMDAALQTVFSGTTVKQIHYGFASSILEFPSILIMNPRRDEQYIGTNYLKQATYSFTVACMVWRPDEETELSLATRFAASVQHILNNPFYDVQELPSGSVLSGCFAEHGDATEQSLGEGQGYASIGSLVWTGIETLQDTGK